MTAKIHFIAVPQSFKEVTKYINDAKTPAERNMRKMEVHGMLYGMGAKKLKDLRVIGELQIIKEDKQS